MQNETAKRDKITTAAAALFAKQGYKKTTVDEIVAGAGVSKGLFYHYFKNKNQLYLHLYNNYTAVLRKAVGNDVNTEETDFFLRLKQIAHIRINFITEYPHLWDFLYSAYYETHPDIAPLIKEKNKALLQASYAGSAANIDWSKLKDGLSPDKAIEIVTWMAEGFVQKIARSSPSPALALYSQFEEYLEYLKTGLYKTPT